MSATKYRKVLSLFVLLILLIGTYPPETGAVEAGGGNAVQQQVLPNGLKVLLLEDHSFPVVACFVWYKVGSRNESPGMTGLSHLVEHLLFQNVGSFKKGELGTTIIRNGGRFNGFTSDDFTAFYEVVHPSKLDLALRVESERMRKATFSAQDLKEEVTRIVQDMDEHAKDPQTLLHQKVRGSAFVEHPYRHPVIGYRSDLENMTLQDVRSFYDRFYYPDNATLILVGDFKAQHAAQGISRYFGNLPKAPAPIPALRVTEQPQRAEIQCTITQPGKRDMVEFAYHAPPLADADAPAMVLIEKLLNGQYSGRLKKITDSKVANTARCSYELKKDPGLFTVTFSIPPGSKQTLQSAWDSAIGQIKSQGVSDSELRRARNQAEYAFYNEKDGPYRSGFTLGFCDSLSNWQTAESWPSKLRSVTVADLQRAAKRYFVPENRVVGLLTVPAQPAKTTPPPTQLNKPPNRPAPAADSETPEAQPKKPARRFEHARLTGYKEGDYDLVRSIIAQQDATVKPAESSAQDTNPSPSTNPVPGTNSVPRSNPSLPINPAIVPAKITPASESSRATTGSASEENSASATSKAAPSKAPIFEGTPANIQKRILKNGITLLVLESHLAPVVQIMGAVKAGSAFEPPSKKGLSDLMVACMNNGSNKTTRSQMQLMQEDLGLPPDAMLHFDLGLETINFQSRCLSKDLQTMLIQLSAVMKDPALQDADIDKAKLDVFALLKQQDSSSMNKAERALLRNLLASDSPYYPDDLSEKVNAISSYKYVDLHDFHDLNVLPEGTTLILTGDITPDAAQRIAEQTLSGWSQKSSTGKSLPNAQPNSRRILKTSLPMKDKAKTFVCMGRLVNMPAGSDNYAQLVLADYAMTKHPLSSRLAQSFGSSELLANNLTPDAVESRFMPLGNSIVWSLNLPVEPSMMPTAAALVQEELRKFARSGVTRDEFLEVRRFLINALPVKQLSDTADAAKTTLDYYFQDHLLFNDQVNRLRASNLENLNKFIHADLKPDQSSLVVAGTKQAIKTVHGSPKTSDERVSPGNDSASKGQQDPVDQDKKTH